MSTQIIPFAFEGNIVRVVMIEDHPWWFLSDLCAILSIRNAAQVCQRLDEDQFCNMPLSIYKTYTQSTRRGGSRPKLVNESGLYSVVRESRKPIGKRFRQWNDGTVLPTIRRTGSYHADADARELLKTVLTLAEPAKVPPPEAAQIGDRVAILEGEVGGLKGEVGDLKGRVDAWEQPAAPRPRRKLSAVDGNTESPRQASFNFPGTPTPVKSPEPPAAEEPPVPVEPPKPPLQPAPPAAAQADVSTKLDLSPPQPKRPWKRPSIRIETPDFRDPDARPKIIFND
jgi:prophage antirepressor-like protein